MCKYRLFVGFFIAALIAVPVLASDEVAPAATSGVDQAQALLEAGKIQEARDAYVAAAKADPENAELRAQAQVLSRVLALESLVASEEPSPKWEKAVVALHVFYLGSDLQAKALAHDRAAHAKADTAGTAGLVAESMLELGQNKEAANFIDDLREGQKDDQIMVFHGIALGRLGRHDEVRENVELYGLPKTNDPNLLFDMARMQALIGDAEPALSSLTSCFENCPSRALPMLKKIVQSNPDLSSIRSHAGFAKVLETASKAAKASGCGCGSAASGCGGCPKKGGGCEGCDK